MNVFIENCIILLQLYCLCLLNTISCKHSHQRKDFLLSNNERRSIEHFFWRQARRSRRKMTTPEPDFHLPNEGPIRTPEYDPTFGYEPYWATGDWVFEIPPEVKGDMCGQVCSPHYRDYGVICGRRRDRKLSMEHKTFNNYCEMMNEDCDGKAVWLIAYRGECRATPKTFPTQAVSLVSRAVHYISAYMAQSHPPRPRRTRSRKRTTTKTSTTKKST